MNKLNWSAEGTTITQEQLDEWVARDLGLGVRHDRTARPDEDYTFKAKKEFKRVGWSDRTTKDGRKKPIYPIINGLCPCKVCGHTFMLECELAEERGEYSGENKKPHCCSEFCT